MGVRGLETFLHNQVPDGVVSINILEEINRMKMERPNQPPVLVFQVVDILYNVFIRLTTTEILCGPAFRKIHKIFEIDFHRLAESGAELHFFVNEPSYQKNFETWTSKESDQYSYRTTLIDKIDSNIAIEEIGNIEQQPGATASMADLLRICETYGTVHFCVNSKYVADVVNYANEKNALAIVGNNSHFLIFHGDWRYWSCRDIDLMEQSWDTMEYNRSALLDHLQLTRVQMPMLATIAGNDFIDRKKTVSFHRQMNGNKFLQLAEYVKQIPNVLTNDEKRQFLLDLFGSSDSHNFEMVRESLLFYTAKKHETGGAGNTEPESLLTCAASVSAIYYNSLTEVPIRVKSPTFYDLRRSDFLPYFDIILPILKRQIGFVRKHRNDNAEYQHVIELRLNHSEPIRSVRVRPEYPIAELPDLMDISFSRNAGHFNGIRFKLLKWMVFGDLAIHFQFFIRHIPKGFMVTVIAVMYLCKLKQLTDLEVNALLLSIHLIHENKDYANDFKPPTHTSARDILALHLYIFVHNTVVKCFLFLGLNGFVDYLSIDGVYYVHWLNKMKSGGDYEEYLSQIEYLKYFLRFI